jgi:glycosyltransferase involved in cell wall biosynthesis
VSRLRAAIVVQRYGAEVNGGAEVQARALAGLLRDDVDVEVLTTCALDYATWADHYPSGTGELDGVIVRRFPVPGPRDASAFDEASRRAYADPADADAGRAWMEAQGPVAPGLLDHLRAHAEGYDAVVFVTYLYATTVLGMPLVGDRAVLLPELHDEPPMRLAVFDPVFADARHVVFNTPEERDLARARFGVEDARATVVGIGVDDPPPVDRGRFAAERGLRRPYVLCIGRIDPSKGTDTLVEYHSAYRTARPDGPDLVLMGGGDMPLPEAPWLHRTGFVGEDEKHSAIAGAAVVVAPSPYESLSLALLEAWSHGRPTLANAASPVLEGQSRRSAGGLWFRDGAEYAVMLDLLARATPMADAIGRQGRRWVRATCTWSRVRDAWLDVLTAVAAARR